MIDPYIHYWLKVTVNFFGALPCNNDNTKIITTQCTWINYGKNWMYF